MGRCICISTCNIESCDFYDAERVYILLFNGGLVELNHLSEFVFSSLLACLFIYMTSRAVMIFWSIYIDNPGFEDVFFSQTMGKGIADPGVTVSASAVALHGGDDGYRLFREHEALLCIGKGIRGGGCAGEVSVTV